ncbi:hypothetical protein QBC46DRAFT_373333 [Diplogelasinospora grovesii]|uniref:Ubiquitin-protein ligase n=1 Tax=Diplogelasinospora grovesii TaxID=303347 RepID=A0AAN6NHC7_9PEZI|nr:hypothetical protein QBC46DRAFT_373333 [Diplogelasinospora grovesii]
MEGAAASPAMATAMMNDSSYWHNLTIWTAQHLGLYGVNMSRLAPSLEDLVKAGPRMVMKLGRLGGSFISFPDAIDSFGQRVIPESTNNAGIFSHASGVTGEFMQSITPPPLGSAAQATAAAAAAAATSDPTAFVSRFSLEGAKGLGSVFSYATSRWALCCMAMAIIFNRTHIFAATRRRLRLRWPVRLALRILPILLLVFQARRLLQSIQCQTSPDFAELRWGNASKSSDLMFSHDNKLLHGLSQTLLLGASDEQSCQAARMVPREDQEEQQELRGSLSRLWPLFGTFCFSQFVEVVSCTVQGRPVAAETGMTLFEHSLAFAEADAAISNQLGWNLFSNGTNSSSQTTVGGASVAVTRAMIMRRVNTPPEVLLVAFLSTMSHMTSHVLGLFNLQAKFRLVSTGFWGLCFMGSMIWSALTFSWNDVADQGLLRFPTVCIIGFIPHVMVLAGITTCGLIYLLTLILSAVAAPEIAIAGEGRRMTFMERLAHAHGNMQANVSLSDIRIRMDMDFYTALLRAGFGAITMASEAVYLNEDRRVNLQRHTWLEEERLREVEELRMQWISGGIPGSRFDSVGTIGLVPIKDGQASATSGYAREKAAQKLSKNTATNRRILRNGVGATERTGRWVMALEYIMHINRLLLTAWSLITLKCLSLVGVRNPPQWLRWLSQRPKMEQPTTADNKKKRSRTETTGGRSADWMYQGDSSSFVIPHIDRVDVEAELRRRLRRTNTNTDNIDNADNVSEGGGVDETEISSRLYSWWLHGGWWGNTDSSGDFVPPTDHEDDPEWDTTSVISTTTTTTTEAETENSSISELDEWLDGDDEDDEDLDDDGQRTPTQSWRRGEQQQQYSRESTPLLDTPIARADLARLLDPQSPEERDEARTLAAHLGSDDRIMTRSRYRQYRQRQRAQVLLTNRQNRGFGGFGGMIGAAAAAAAAAGQMMTPDEEARCLEQIILSSRRATISAGGWADGGGGGEEEEEEGGAGVIKDGTSWATGAAGLGPDGPQCVVCQSSPRTIIVWPCRCLSLCDDCRVSLAMNNFDKCVCCRREVISFSRIYVP